MDPDKHVFSFSADYVYEDICQYGHFQEQEDMKEFNSVFVHCLETWISGWTHQITNWVPFRIFMHWAAVLSIVHVEFIKIVQANWRLIQFHIFTNTEFYSHLALGKWSGVSASGVELVLQKDVLTLSHTHIHKGKHPQSIFIFTALEEKKHHHAEH